MSRFRVPRSTFLAITSARQAVAVDAALEARDVRKVLDALDALIGMLRARTSHIGLVNDLLRELLEFDSVTDITQEWIDRAGDLMTKGINLAVENSGFGEGGQW